MPKRTVFTTITPLPPVISRDTALSFLHNHVEMIDLNPLIKERHPIHPPDHCPADEQQCIWYSLTDKISYLPGGVMSGEVTYTCAFHDLPDGLQTHCYAPMGLDIRDKWTIGGSLPGEPQQPVELGLGAPQTGLYIREDIDMRCNILMASFVKKTLKKAHATLVDHLSAKAKSISVSDSSDAPPRLSLHNDQARRPSGSSSRRSSPRSSGSYIRPSNARGQSPHSLIGQNGGLSHVRSSSAGAHPPRYQLPPQQHLQQPYQEMASWRASDVPTRQGTQYVGSSRPQDYVDFATMNPYDNAASPTDQPVQQYRPYSSHNKVPPLPTQLPHHRHHLSELE